MYTYIHTYIHTCAKGLQGRWHGAMLLICMRAPDDADVASGMLLGSEKASRSLWAGPGDALLWVEASRELWWPQGLRYIRI